MLKSDIKSKDPDIVILSGQTPEEVKNILKNNCDPLKDKIDELKFFKFDAKIEEEPSSEHILSHDSQYECGVDLMSDFEFSQPEIRSKVKPEINRNRIDFDLIYEWRKTAGLHSENEKLIKDVINPSKKLMDKINLMLNDALPELRITWVSPSYNPRLAINDAPTKITLEKLAISYKGLLNITDETNAETAVCDIVLKKIKELFI